MSDESVCELLEVGLGMLARARLGEGLRGMAQGCVQGIVRAAFGRLRGLTQEDVDGLLEAGRNASRRGSKASVKKDEEGAGPEQEQEEDDDERMPYFYSISSFAKLTGLAPLFTPYGLPTILELLRVLIALLNPSDQAHTDSMRLSALAILNTALETGGSSLGNWPELLEGVRDEGCRYLFQVSRMRSGIRVLVVRLN